MIRSSLVISSQVLFIYILSLKGTIALFKSFLCCIEWTFLLGLIKRRGQTLNLITVSTWFSNAKAIQISKLIDKSFQLKIITSYGILQWRVVLWCWFVCCVAAASLRWSAVARRPATREARPTAHHTRSHAADYYDSALYVTL